MLHSRRQAGVWKWKRVWGLLCGSLQTHALFRPPESSIDCWWRLFSAPKCNSTCPFIAGSLLAWRRTPPDPATCLHASSTSALPFRPGAGRPGGRHLCLCPCSRWLPATPPAHTSPVTPQQRRPRSSRQPGGQGSGGTPAPLPCGSVVRPCCSKQQQALAVQLQHLGVLP